jgi:Cu(I)/Ag(I) efflux system membrane fusion protein
MRNTFLCAIIFLLAACQGEQAKEDHTGHELAHAQQAPAKYTCPMHPQVLQDGPGKCPVCGMDLVPVSQSSSSDNMIMLSDSQIKLANITTQKVAIKPVGQNVVVNGTLSADESRTETISSRAAGRVERLSIKESGRVVRKGETLYELYSEQLLTLQREYLLAKEQYESLGASEARYESFLKAAEGKLILYGLTKEQVEKLATSKSVQDRIAFLSPASGIVSEVAVAEGQYVTEGQLLYRIEDTGRLWVQAELYPNEIGWVKEGDRIQLRVSGYEREAIEATVDFLSPEYRNNSQILIARASIANVDRKLQPGMQAQLTFTHSSRNGIAVPSDALIRDANGAHVYVQTDVNTFQPRMVKTGAEDFNQVEVLEGLMENETVAVTGAYLIYSEFILKKGSDPMAGHSH